MNVQHTSLQFLSKKKKQLLISIFSTQGRRKLHAEMVKMPVISPFCYTTFSLLQEVIKV